MVDPRDYEIDRWMTYFDKVDSLLTLIRDRYRERFSLSAVTEDPMALAYIESTDARATDTDRALIRTIIDDPVRQDVLDFRDSTYGLKNLRPREGTARMTPGPDATVTEKRKLLKRVRNDIPVFDGKLVMLLVAASLFSILSVVVADPYEQAVVLSFTALAFWSFAALACWLLAVGCLIGNLSARRNRRMERDRLRRSIDRVVLNGET